MIFGLAHPAMSATAIQYSWALYQEPEATPFVRGIACCFDAWNASGVVDHEYVRPRQ